MNLRPLLLTSPLMLATLGCQTDADLARQALRTQAEQNQAMAQSQREVAAGARALTAADADARRQAIKLHVQIQSERTRLSEGWSELHAQRDRAALSQRTESFLTALVQGGGATAAALLALAIVRTVVNARGDDDADLASLMLDMCQTSEHAPDPSSQVQASTPPTMMRLASNTSEEP